jgi:RNA 2',3'-cyclic 3'-phosphodiesterase
VKLFFALWPGAAAAEVLERLAADVVVVAGGKPMPRAKIHLTLAYLGEVEDLAAAQDAAAGLHSPAFDVRLDCVGSFRRARVSWAGSLEANPPLLELQSTLEARLRDRGFRLEERPFTPHVTLARKAEKALPRARIAPIEWNARELTLVRSMPTGEYPVLKGWKLG